MQRIFSIQGATGTGTRFLLAVLLAFGLLLQLGSAQASAVQRTCSAEPTDDTLVYGDLITCDIDPGFDQDEFRFTGAVGEVVRIQIARQSGAGGTCLELFRPDGTTLAASCPNANSTSVNPTLDQSGQYRIRVSDYGGNHIMPYALGIDRLAPASPVATPLDPGALLDDIISPLGEFDLYTFNGEIGDQITLQGTDTTGTAAGISLQLIDPNGVALTNPTNVNQLTINRTLTEAGIYSVLIYEYGNNHPDMTYNLSYSCSGICPSLVAKRRYIDTASIEDLNGNGQPEVAAIFQNRNTWASNLVIRDGDTRATIKTVPVFGSAVEPLGLAAVGDSTGDLVSELAVLGLNLNNGAIRVWLVDPVAGSVIASNTFFYSAFSPVSITKVEDLDGDTVPEIGVMAVNKATNAVTFRVKEVVGWTTLKNIGYPK